MGDTCICLTSCSFSEKTKFMGDAELWLLLRFSFREKGDKFLVIWWKPKSTFFNLKKWRWCIVLLRFYMQDIVIAKQILSILVINFKDIKLCDQGNRGIFTNSNSISVKKFYFLKFWIKIIKLKQHFHKDTLLTIFGLLITPYTETT